MIDKDRTQGGGGVAGVTVTPAAAIDRLRGCLGARSWRHMERLQIGPPDVPTKSSRRNSRCVGMDSRVAPTTPIFAAEVRTSAPRSAA